MFPFRFLFLFGFVGVVSIGSMGCSDGPARAAPVDPAKAKTALLTALDAWKAGKSIDSLAKEEPSIIAQDFDWMARKKLAKYQVQGDGKAQDANLRVPVKLTILDGDGEPQEKTVIYIVGTDIKLTVFRALE